MKMKFSGSVLAALVIILASAAFAAGLDGFVLQKERSVTMNSGKSVKIMVGKMHDKMMVVIPMDDLNELYMRAEGHAMSIP
ncbi:hypothetical protein [Methylocapsa palsarum]|uniref:Copper binding protein CusF n=1 Tax=Methylocapsa palsarum TaxID=1612308 RepID=A0A1I4AEJ1_9HYPH|nr:hypothetical protein [Methylocapsa palsarum]SFK54828.1 hypothetical protein SAMN05444581_11051 [Methylocapsa palsarum]